MNGIHNVIVQMLKVIPADLSAIETVGGLSLYFTTSTDALPRRTDKLQKVRADIAHSAQRLNVSLRSCHPDVSVFPDRVAGSTCALSFSRIARRSLALRPAHSRCHQFVTR
jgi:hypothetical protein